MYHIVINLSRLYWSQVVHFNFQQFVYIQNILVWLLIYRDLCFQVHWLDNVICVVGDNNCDFLLFRNNVLLCNEFLDREGNSKGHVITFTYCGLKSRHAITLPICVHKQGLLFQRSYFPFEVYILDLKCRSSVKGEKYATWLCSEVK